MTEVSFRLEVSGSRTRLTVIHGELKGCPDQERAALIDAHRRGWRHHLEQLRRLRRMVRE